MYISDAIVRFSDVHSFDKPNDIRALQLMNTAAKSVLNEYKDVVMAFGESDEYRWGVLSLANQTLHSQKPASYYEEQQHSIIDVAGKWTCPMRSCLLPSFAKFRSRTSKINSSIVSLFTSAYVFHWTRFFPNTPLLYPPSFDGRVVLYPNVKEVRDYFSWRQADSGCLILVYFCGYSPHVYF